MNIDTVRAVARRAEIPFCSSCLMDRPSLLHAVDVRERSGCRSESGKSGAGGAMLNARKPFGVVDLSRTCGLALKMKQLLRGY